MLSPIRKNHSVLKIINGSLYDLPAPGNLSIWWNFGSLLGICLVIQILTGIFLAIHYTGRVEIAFRRVAHISRDVNYGWFIRYTHANSGSWFFICLYLHVGRGIYYGSYINIHTWNIGVIILLLVMMTAFLGYVLPWGQISFWAATVITNLLSAIPYVGKMLVEWIWGGFAIDNATLRRFYAFHFLFPFVIAALSALHILFLHETGSNNPLGVNSDSEKIPFHIYYTVKDFVGFIVVLFFLCMLVLLSPHILTDPENFIPANPLVTPVHIQPEWYFLFAYVILRSIPNKLGGVVALVISVLILFIMPVVHLGKFRSNAFYPLNQILFWCLVGCIIILTWIGVCPVEIPYYVIGQIFTFFYFSFFIIHPLLHKIWDNIIYV